jgi:hypothetical protein
LGPLPDALSQTEPDELLLLLAHPLTARVSAASATGIVPKRRKKTSVHERPTGEIVATQPLLRINPLGTNIPQSQVVTESL